MTVDKKAQLLYLNRENRWLGFDQRGLELKDGRFTLASLPLSETTLADELAKLPTPNGPAGLAVGDDGTIYFTDPQQHRILRINSCDGETCAAPCLGGEGYGPTSFVSPRGLLFNRRRRALFVADSGNHRVQIFNTDTFQLVDIWGETADAQSSDEPGSFDTPWSLAADGKGNVYVVDVGNHRVQKFDPVGQVVKSFWTTAGGAFESDLPTEVAVANADGRDVIIVLAPASSKLFVFDTGGQHLNTFEAEELKNAVGLTVDGTAIYVGDNDRRRILKFWFDGTFVGEARGYNGPVAALAFDQLGQLLVHTGSADFEILRVSPAGAYAKHGLLWGGPFGAGNPRLKDWFSLKAIPDQLPNDAHLRLFTYTTDDKLTPPPVAAKTDDPFSAPGWKAMPLDVRDGLIGGESKSYIWVGVELSGEGLTTPTLSQLTLEYDHDGYLRYFPAIYRDDPIKRAFLESFLALYESFFDDTEQTIRRLSALFDVHGAPAEFLDWLAGWLALDLDERWTEQKKRSAIARAFELYGRRGTAAGLRDALRFFAGVEARIEEPILYSSWWALPADAESEQTEGAMLGFNTTLAPEQAQGAVVGTTATYDESSLITIDEFGAPLFANVAHRFIVRLHGVGSAKRQKEIAAIIEREKPAHTMAHVCPVQPGLTIGFQAQIGIDSVLGGESPLARLDQSSLGGELRLGGDPAGRVGEQSQLGQTTRLGYARP